METNPVKIAADAAKELGLDKLAPTVYRDVLQPAAKETGKNLLVVAKAVGIAISPLKVTVWGYEQASSYLLTRVTAKLASKPANEIRTPDPLVAGPVIMGMAFASEAPHLREMYANLLATAMYSPSASKAHPSFATAIQQLSPGEALILKAISKIGPEFEYQVGNAIAMAYGGNQLDADQIGAVEKYWRNFCNECGTSDPVLADAYRNNLVRLGIL